MKCNDAFVDNGNTVHVGIMLAPILSLKCFTIATFVTFACLASLVANSGVSEERVLNALKNLETLVERERKDTGVPGLAIAVVFQDRLIYAKGFGVREIDKPDPVDSDTVFQIASISKPIGATVIATLVGRNVVTWDTKIRDLDPDFALFDPAITDEVTIGDLYAHRSGLPEHIGDQLEDMGFSQEEILRRLRYQPLAGPFRKFYAYTNFGMTQAAIAAASKAGSSWEALSEELLYKPLGMLSTSSRFSDFAARANRASGHQKIDGDWVHREQRQPDAQSPAGGVSSSVNDMALWMRLQLNEGKFDGEQIVESAALEQTHLPQIDAGNGGHYGYGWNVGRDAEDRLRLSHSGAFMMGAATVVMLVPSEQLGITILTNAAPIGLPEALAAHFIDEVLYGRATRDWFPLFRQAFAEMSEADFAITRQYQTPPDTPLPAPETGLLVGTYHNDFYGELVITAEEEGIFMTLGPNAARFPMSHWNGSTFTYQTVGEYGGITSGVFFTLGKDNASSVTLEVLNANKNGTFTRISR